MSKKIATIHDIRQECGDNRVIAVGDIHGCFEEFIALLEKCDFRLGHDIVVSVGDLVDRGPQIKDVMKWFRMQTRHGYAYVAKGNHDDKAQRYWMGNKVSESHGLSQTIEQCKDMNHNSLVSWMDTFPHIIRVPDVNGKPTYIVHAGVDGRKPMEQQRTETCIYARFLDGKNFFDSENGIPWWETLDGSYNIISGHIIQENPRPVECSYCLDSGAYEGGGLRGLIIEGGQATIVEVPSGTYCQPICKFDQVAKRDALVKRGQLRCDDLDDLRVYTYTDKCVHDKNWNEITTHSRGHIFDRSTGELVACSLPKFFNVGETPETQMNVLPWYVGYDIFEKKDGWLGNLYRHNGQFAISTRGSFHSPGAVWATEFLRNNYDLTYLPDEVTLVFELISPITKIIVDYGDTEDLVLLAAFNRHTGEEYPWSYVCDIACLYKFSLPDKLRPPFDQCQLMLENCDGKEIEGFVVRFLDGTRVKIKSEDYLRRARILSRLSPLSVWGAMQNGIVGLDYLTAIDPEYRQMAHKWAHHLQNQFHTVMNQIDDEFQRIYRIGVATATRKAFAKRVEREPLVHKQIMFAYLDHKSKAVEKYVMENIRPNNNQLETV